MLYAAQIPDPDTLGGSYLEATLVLPVSLMEMVDQGPEQQHGR